MFFRVSRLRSQFNNCSFSSVSGFLDTGKKPSEPPEPEFPSDFEEYRMQEWIKYNKIRRKQERKAKRPLVDPKDTSIFLFPGQGSQYIGMGKDTLNYPNVRNFFDEASLKLGFDLLKLCLEGPVDELNKTVNCQPAIFVCSLAAIEKLKHVDPTAIENCISVAGYSLGEITSLVFSGAMSFEDGLKVVCTRANAMQKASESIPSGLMAVFLNSSSKLGYACKTSVEYCQNKLKIFNPICSVASYLYPECKVIGGHQQALEFIKQNLKEFNINRVKLLNVSGAFHTKLMEPACEELKRVLDSVRISLPIVFTYSNVEARPFKNEKEIRSLLVKQIIKPLKWEQCLHTIYSRDQEQSFPRSFELGPGQQLGSILKATNRKAFMEYKSLKI